MIIKVCGMREPDNIREVEALHPTMMGFICWNKSPRYINAAPTYLPTECQRVCVFVNPSINYALQMADSLKADYLQLHGLKIIKAISIANSADIEKSEKYQGIADIMLFDTKCATVGGGGVKFDWGVLENYDGATPFMLSGGITLGDAEAVLSITHPMFAGVDLNSGFESSPAVKFITSIRYEQN